MIEIQASQRSPVHAISQNANSYRLEVMNASSIRFRWSNTPTVPC